MKGARRLCGLVFLAGGLAATTLSAQDRRAPERLASSEKKFTPRFEALAETSLLMEGLAQPNYRALEKHLQGKGPADGETWTFARGQALLIAETGNLLLLRPPRNAGREIWMRRAVELRQSAGNLARRLGTSDLPRSRVALRDLANTCNNCHRTFRVHKRIGPNEED